MAGPVPLGNGVFLKFGNPGGKETGGWGTDGRSVGSRSWGKEPGGGI